MARVALEGVTKRFGKTTAVEDVTLEVHDQEFLVLLGPSGCGKSTVLRMIAGLEEPTSGRIFIGDRDVTDLEPKARDIAMVFQSYALYPHMTVRRNIEFPLRSRGEPREAREEAVRTAAHALGLEELLDRRPAQLSGGQRQRVALARAIVRRPQVFLMDEPLSNLDAKLRVQTRAELIELQRRLAGTVIYVTHDQVEAMTMGDRIAIIANGRMQQVDAPQTVYEKPGNLFVAGFIGNPPMNTITGKIVHDGAVSLEAAGGRIPLPDSLVAVADGHAEVVLGVRPEHLQLSVDGPVTATVSVIESLGHERHLVCRLADEQMVIVRQESEEAAPAVGASVHLSAEESRLHLFDAATGVRLG